MKHFVRNPFIFVAILSAVAISCSSQDESLRCLACTDNNSDQLTLEIRDPKWAAPLRRIPSLPRVNQCAIPDEILKGRRKDCPTGVCMSLQSKKEDGTTAFVLRTCLPNTKGQLANGCTPVPSGKGEMNICICDGEGCDPLLPMSAFRTVAVSLSGLVAVGVFVAIFGVFRE